MQCILYATFLIPMKSHKIREEFDIQANTKSRRLMLEIVSPISPNNREDFLRSRWTFNCKFEIFSSYPRLESRGFFISKS